MEDRASHSPAADTALNLDPTGSAALVPVAAAPEPLADTPLVHTGGVSRLRAAALVAGLACVGLTAYATVTYYTLMPMPGERLRQGAMIAAGVGVLGLLLRPLIAVRAEYRITGEGIERRVWYGRESRPWIALIRWTDIADYRVSQWANAAHLGVESADGVRITLKDVPPRHSTREFIRRFSAEAERHPRAVRRTERMDEAAETKWTLRGAMHVAVAGTLVVLHELVGDRAPLWVQLAGLGALLLTVGGIAFWLQLDDSDVAYADRTAGTRGARLRNRVRRLLGMPVI